MRRRTEPSAEDTSAASIGQVSTSYRLNSSNRLAADIGSWIKDDIVDVWFPPGPDANNWGIQRLTLTVE